MTRKILWALLVFVGCVLGGYLGQVLPAFGSHNNVGDTFDLVPFRGRLEKGELPYSSAVQMTFSIYDAPANGNLLYVEDVASVQPDPDGNFAVVLGRNGHDQDGNDKSLRQVLRGSNAYYVGVTVAGVPLDGRQRLLAAPFAARVSGIRSGDIADGEITAADIADGGVLKQHLSSLGCAPKEHPVRSDGGTTWECDDSLPTTEVNSSTTTPPAAPNEHFTELGDDDGRTFCFLVHVAIQAKGLDVLNSCSIGADFPNHEGKITLRAQSSGSSLAVVGCSARCITW